ncbi:MAG: gliding motility-associated C-terminal domain-containing protein [Niastella sp.]|nr:gliding motility-associated C-terminal domain-containing protein [Niastella sp.]
MRKILLLIFCVAGFQFTQAQSLSYNCAKDTVLGCGINCFNITERIPDIKDLTSNYVVKNISSEVGACYPIVSPADPGPSTNLIIDDRYSSVLTLPFSFPFYQTPYSSVVASTNGLISFNVALTGGFSHWQNYGNLPNNQYDGAIVMGPYHDLYPVNLATLSPTAQIKYQTFGTAPNRKWILSFYKVPLFDCTSLIENTHQIILHESSGIIEVDIRDMQICNTWPTGTPGVSMIGIQDITKTKSVMAPGRTMTDPPWGSIGMNEIWRFIPSGGNSLYQKVELLDGTGSVIATGDTVRVDASTFEVAFNNICPTNATETYVVKTTYRKIDDPNGTFYSLDTINVTKNAMPVNASSTATTCGSNSGTITVTAGSGTPPLTYTLQPGNISNNTGIFTGLANGTYTITVVDATGTCSNSIQATVALINSLTSNESHSNASCPGVANGSITITPTNGVPPYLYSANGGPFQPSNIFTNLLPGNYTITFTDAGGCAGTKTVTISPGTNINASATSTGTSCSGAHDGTITVTPGSGGIGPFTFSIDGLPAQVSNVFTGVTNGSHIITVIDSRGCTVNITVTVSSGAGLTGSIAQTPISCPGNADGTVTLTPLTGVPPYSYNIDGGLFQPSNVFTGLTSGVHTVIFKDNNGCQGTRSITVGGGSGPSGTQTHTNTTCNGATDGTITITPSAPGSYTYILNPGAITQASNIFTGLAAGTYSVTFTSGAGCSGTLTNIIISVGGSLSGTSSTVATSCSGAADGTITITPTIPGPHTYVLTGPGGPYTQTTATFTGLAAGTYAATFTNATGCSGNLNNLVVSAGSSLSGSQTHSGTTCQGASDGSITITPAVAGTYTYVLTGPGGPYTQSNGTFTGLAQGTYSATFTNASTCSGTINNIIISAGPAITGTASSTATSCSGASDGTLTITASVPGTYTYILNPGAITQTNPVFTGLAAGTYSVSFSNSLGCSATVNNIIISAGASLTGTASPGIPTCQGASDGSIGITPTVAGTYTYTLNPGAITQSNGMFTGLTAGTYSVTFSNSFGCSGTLNNIVVPAGPLATASPTIVGTTCQGASDGTITLSPAIAGTYTYTLNPGAITQTNPLFTGLTAGTYNFSFTNTLGCSGTLNNVIVSAGPPLAANVVKNNTSCTGVNDGTITVTPTTPGTFTYALNPGAVTQTNGNFTNLAPNTYSVTVTNSLGCSYTENNIIVAAGAPLTGTSVPTATSCPTVNDGTITLSPTGTGPYTFTLNPGNIVQSSPTFTGLAAGTYTISFVSAAGCTGTIPVNPIVGMGSPIASTFIPVNPPCNGINDGQVTILPSSGAAPFSFTLTDGSTPQTNNTGIFTALSPNVLYNYSFTDAIGCTGTGSFTLTTHTALKMPNINTMPLCNGDANGSIKLNGGGGVSPYQYAMGPGFASFQTANTFTGLAMGNYSFRIKDAVGCTKDTTINLSEPTQLTASATNSLASTCFGNDGKITVTGIGGTTPYQYSINGTAYQSSAVITAPAIGPYPNIKVKDAKGCIASAAPINVVLNDTMRLTLGPDTTVCAESAKTIYPQTNAATSIFTWTSLDAPASTIQDANVKNAVVSPTDTARYALLAKWGICQRKDTVQINVLRKPIAHAGFDTAVCYRTPATLYGSATNTSGSVIYTWTPAGGLSNPNAAVTQVTTTNDGTFIYTLTVTDNYGCNFSHSDEVIVTVTPPVPAFAGNDTIAVLGQPHQLFGLGGVQYVWAPAAVLNNAFAQNPLAILQQDTRFTLTVKDIAGCEGWDTVFIKVYAGPTYYVPNAFSPNGDGRNDIFRPIPSGITSTEYFRVFNRLGELVFETNEWLKGWDGFYLGRKQPVGTYVWVIKGKDKNGKIVQQKGTVVLLQ